MAKILILDIETSPNLAYVWRFFKENIGAKQVLDHTQIMSFAFKWLHSDEIAYADTRLPHVTEKTILPVLIAALDEADIVVAHNGNRFDLPVIQGRAMVLGLKPPSPYKTVDTLLVSRYEFKFPSNSLEYLSKIFNVEEKDQHKEFPGFELWAECLKGNQKAWEEMELYNIQDVITLEQIYLKMRPWMRRHPNIGVFNDEVKVVCPKCGSDHLHSRGYAYTNVGKYRKLQCQNCGGWSRTRYTENSLEKRKSLVANAV